MIRSQRCQDDSAVSCGHSKTPKRGNHEHLTTPKLGSPSAHQTNPSPNNKLEFPAQAQTSETQPKLKIFLFPKAQVGSLSTRELLSVFPLASARQQELIQLDPMPTPSQVQPCQDALLSSLLSWLQGVPRCTQMASHRIQNISYRSSSGSTSHRSSAAWEVCSSTSLLEGPSPCTSAVCSKLWFMVTARGYSPYLYFLQKVGSSMAVPWLHQ